MRKPQSKPHVKRTSAVAQPAAAPVTTDTVMHQLRGILHDIFDPYRPELHYMRGPGPAWRAKHEAPAEPSAGEPLVARAS